MFTINGKHYTVNRLTQEDVDRSDSLEQTDVGKLFIVLNGCIQFV